MNQPSERTHGRSCVVREQGGACIPYVRDISTLLEPETSFVRGVYGMPMPFSYGRPSFETSLQPDQPA